MLRTYLGYLSFFTISRGESEIFRKNMKKSFNTFRRFYVLFVARLRPGRMVTRQRTMIRGVHSRECGSLVERVAASCCPICCVFFSALRSEETHRAPVAQLVEHRAVTREVVSSTPAGPTLSVFK